MFISEGTNVGSTTKFGSLYYLNYQFDGPEEMTIQLRNRTPCLFGISDMVT